MSLSTSDTYLETQVNTATPQRLRLMLIEEALRQARAVQELWSQGQVDAGSSKAARCREILSELISGIHPDQTSVAKRVLGLYLFLFSSLTEAQLTRDTHQLAGVIRVLEEERETWEAVCRELPDRQAADPRAAVKEELAPHRVDDVQSLPHGPTLSSISAVAPTFSIEA
jgi:flagellar secretion chaperone FliS